MAAVRTRSAMAASRYLAFKSESSSYAFLSEFSNRAKAIVLLLLDVILFRNGLVKGPVSLHSKSARFLGAFVFDFISHCKIWRGIPDFTSQKLNLRVW